MYPRFCNIGIFPPFRISFPRYALITPINKGDPLDSGSYQLLANLAILLPCHVVRARGRRAEDELTMRQVLGIHVSKLEGSARVAVTTPIFTLFRDSFARDSSPKRIKSTIFLRANSTPLGCRTATAMANEPEPVCKRLNNLHIQN